MVNYPLGLYVRKHLYFEYSGIGVKWVPNSRLTVPLKIILHVSLPLLWLVGRCWVWFLPGQSPRWTSTFQFSDISFIDYTADSDIGLFWSSYVLSIWTSSPLWTLENSHLLPFKHCPSSFPSTSGPCIRWCWDSQGPSLYLDSPSKYPCFLFPFLIFLCVWSSDTEGQGTHTPHFMLPGPRKLLSGFIHVVVLCHKTLSPRRPTRGTTPVYVMGSVLFTWDLKNAYCFLNRNF